MSHSERQFYCSFSSAENYRRKMQVICSKYSRSPLVYFTWAATDVQAKKFKYWSLCMLEPYFRVDEPYLAAMREIICEKYKIDLLKVYSSKKTQLMLLCDHEAAKIQSSRDMRIIAIIRSTNLVIISDSTPRKNTNRLCTCKINHR